MYAVERSAPPAAAAPHPLLAPPPLLCCCCREQYGEPVCVLDLVKRVERRPRESVLGCEYAAAVR